MAVAFCFPNGDHDVIVPYNLGDTVYMRTEEYSGGNVISCKVFAIHLTMANKRSHITLVPDNAPMCKIHVRLDELREKIFSSFKEAQRGW
jgi:hypothetical protein